MSRFKPFQPAWESGIVDLSAQSGSELIIKYETANTKEQRIHAHYFGVSA